jgi:hypothetical protein
MWSYCLAVYLHFFLQNTHVQPRLLEDTTAKVLAPAPNCGKRALLEYPTLRMSTAGFKQPRLDQKTQRGPGGYRYQPKNKANVYPY